MDYIGEALRGDGVRISEPAPHGVVSCPAYSCRISFLHGFRFVECRWNYIAHNDGVAGSNPASSNTMGL
jgi:hypothetical protein